jgi:flavin reductase (DIM6/NTAB) family NADH-FMN oxidoreductase RutF
VDKKAKKKVLQMIPYGSYVVGTKMADGKDHLMFGTWLMQTSFKPTLLAFAFSEDSRTLVNVRRSAIFAVSFLAAGMKDVAEHVVDGHFEKVKVERTPSGLPVVAGHAGWIECRVLEVFEKGDHRITLAEVADVAGGAGALMELAELKWHYGG